MEQQDHLNHIDSPLKLEVPSKDGTYIESLGLSDHPFGIQIDMNVVFQRPIAVSESNTEAEQRTEVALCDHNCTTQYGGYDCPAAFSLPQNKGADKKTLVPFDTLLKGLDTSIKGLRLLQPAYIKALERLGYSDAFISYVKEHGNQVEVNLFGGNPEMYPRIADVIMELKKRGAIVNLTTTGGKFFVSDFTERICRAQPNVIALSADDLPQDIEKIRELAHMSSNQLKAIHTTINPKAGQQRKAIEAIHAANLSNERNDFPSVVFNLVVHPRNIANIEKIMEVLGELYPHAKLNPYPAQSAFMHGVEVFTNDEVKNFESFIDMMIEKHIKQANGNKETFQIVPRMHYWILLKAVYITYPQDWKKISRVLSGYEAWQCYHDPILSGRYLQIGASNKEAGQKVDGSFPKPGGHPGCFWNIETVTDPTVQVWNVDANTIRKHISVRMRKTPKESQNPCPGCLMPRLVFDEPSLLGGIPDPELRKNYLILRNTYVSI